MDGCKIQLGVAQNEPGGASRRCWSMFPLTRFGFWYRLFEPLPFRTTVQKPRKMMILMKNTKKRWFPIISKRCRNSSIHSMSLKSCCFPRKEAQKPCCSCACKTLFPSRSPLVMPSLLTGIVWRHEVQNKCNTSPARAD